MELSPRLYHWLIRPRWFSKLCIKSLITSYFNFDNKTVLDFGSGVGICSTMFNPAKYIGLEYDSKRVQYAKLLYPEYTFSVLKDYFLPVQDSSIDYIIIISVLHHIPPEDLPGYIKDFRRVIKPDGKVLVIEPCFLKNNYLANKFMKFVDRGKYIHDEDGYLKIFTESNFQVDVLKIYKQLIYYNKLFFMATPR